MIVSSLISKNIGYLLCSKIKFGKKFITGLSQSCANNEDSLSKIPEYVDLNICPDWKNDAEDIKYGLLSGMTIVRDFITETEEEILLKQVEPHLKRLRYEFDHWDDAIHGYREVERSDWQGSAAEALQRARKYSLVNLSTALPHIHVLDLDSKGYIKPHVDAVRFCGSTVAGLCLLSPAIMRLRHTNKTDLFADFLLSRRCLYIMKDSARYDFTHEILKNEESFFKNQQIVRTRRISLINRSQPSS